MSQQINIYALKMTPKQKKDLLGIYQDYLYFSQGLELVLNNNTMDSLSYMFIKKVNWDKVGDLPWKLSNTSPEEKENYINFAQNQAKDYERYTYISLYRTETADDIKCPKIYTFPNTHEFTTIDLDLPCPIERYLVVCPKNQKMKDAVFLIDGTFKLTYTGTEFGETSVIDGLTNSKAQDEFRVLFNLADYYDKHKYEIESQYADDVMKHMSVVMKKIMATEILSCFENKILELLGSYGDKTQDILYSVYSGKSFPDVWAEAEKDKLIDSAETMRHYMNIRNLMRHQWDMLDGTGRFALGGNQKNESLRDEYLQSYHLIFSNPLRERIKLYQKFAMQMQTLLKVIYPEFLTRENGESNSKFVSRLKEWQRQNPTLIPMVSVNYLASSEKKSALVRNIGKIVPQAKILDNMTEEDLKNFREIENSYFYRTWFLKLYDHLESNMQDYCFLRGKFFNRQDMWNYFKKNVLSPREYNIWEQYRQLRNELSHNHLNLELRESLASVVTGNFGEDTYKLLDFIHQNTLQMTRNEDGTFSVIQKDGSIICVDIEKRKILSHVDKQGRNLLRKVGYHAEAKADSFNSPVKVNWQEREIIDCKLGNGIYINLRRRKICFPDGSLLYLDAKNYNVFQFENNSKIFTDKKFMITKFLEQGCKYQFNRNETRIVAPKHSIKTDGKKQISESSLLCSEGQKMVTRFKSDASGTRIIFSDGTSIETSAGQFVISHNGIVLDYNHRHAFIQSYQPPLPGAVNSGMEL